MIDLLTTEAYADAIKEGKSVIYFTTKWCPDCFFINPHLDAIENQFPQYTFYRVDRDQHIALCQHLNILGIPSFLAYEDGQEIGRFVSKMRKTKDEVIRFIESL